jgi:mono/diheme cytochrome c family protein
MKFPSSWRQPLGFAASIAAVLVIAYLGWFSVTSVNVGSMQKKSAPEATPTALQLARGRTPYEQHCAVCHGLKLEGQPNWRERLPNGRLPAPPHDDTGHTWHHSHDMLFGIVKYGLVPGKYAPPNYESDMPAFGGVLSDAEIDAVLAYISSHWSAKIQAFRADLARQDRHAAGEAQR